MNKQNDLLSAEKLWKTQMGGWFGAEQRVVYRGKDLFHELQDHSWIELLLLGITGREFSKQQIELFNALWVISTSYPDPRLWNNRVAALAGTARSTASLAISASNAVSEAVVYGWKAELRCMDFLQRSMKKKKTGLSLEKIIQYELKKYKNISGYGRPIPIQDERIKPLLAKATALNLAGGDYLQLAFKIEAMLLKKHSRNFMNIAAIIASLLTDQGLTTKEGYYFMGLGFSAGIYPCFIEASEKPEGHFFPIRCERIEYRGVKQRQWSDRKTE
ncbi:MAG: citrate/2-methylcitrate synthase [Gammaproteobacteria bacterium]|nr:citrate/2-methylcitrate synthase [Gammaproteobacteria bacterium]